MATINIDPEKIRRVQEKAATVRIERVEDRLSDIDLHDLCDATTAAIDAGGGFGWLSIPDQEKLQRYWAGCFMIDERKVLLARVDGMIAGSTQLHLAPPNNEAQAAIGTLTVHFVAPWARGLQLGGALIHDAEQWAVALGLKALKTDLRATQNHAVTMLESLGYERWGTLDRYAYVDDCWVQGHFYFKDLG